MDKVKAAWSWLLSHIDAHPRIATVAGLVVGAVLARIL